jgi:hypothetical protein
VEDAHQQIASVLSFFDQQQIRISLLPLQFEALQGHRLSSNTESISDCSLSDNESLLDEDL